MTGPILPYSSRSSGEGANDDEQAYLLHVDLDQHQEKSFFSTNFSRKRRSSDSRDRSYTEVLQLKAARITSTVRNLSRRNYIICGILVTTIFIAFGLSTTTEIPHRLLKQAGLSSNKTQPAVEPHHSEHVVDGLWPDALGAGGTTDLCDICDCTVQPGIYAPKASASRYEPRPRVQTVYPTERSVNRDEYMRQSILDIYCSRQHMSTSETTRLVRRTANHLEQMVSWNISGLDFKKPTVYLTSNTSPNGKAKELRPQFFRRHARTIRDWENVQEHLHNSSRLGQDSSWQVLWVIVEDELDIDPQVIRTLRRIGVPYVYFAYGPTNGLGHAQRNAALQLIYTLTQTRRHSGLYGHGPVYCLDDDNKMAPELFDLLTRLQRIGVFPVGNFGVKGGYEKPIISPIGEVMGSNSPWPHRKYPFDNAGFAFNSSLLGTTISGPSFWKWNKYGGESEFIGQIVSDIRQLEPICGRDPVQDCHYTWHNEPLVEIEKLTDDAEEDFMQRFGRDMWLARLDEQLKGANVHRGY